jgi:hypothetical protein
MKDRALIGHAIILRRMLMANLNAILDVGQVFGKGHQFPAPFVGKLKF